MKIVLSGIAAAALLVACHSGDHVVTAKAAKPASGATAPVGARAVATLSSAAGSQVTGTVTFEQLAEGVAVKTHVEHLPPGTHGFHIHEKGDCSAPDFESAGGHFNPGGERHGDPTAAQHHAGDLGNLIADGAGVADTSFVNPGLTLVGPNTIIGRSVVVHASADDMITQPSGNSGARIACGAIRSQ